MKRTGWLSFGFMIGLVSTSFGLPLDGGQFSMPLQLIPGLLIVATGITFLQFVFWLVSNAKNAR